MEGICIKWDYFVEGCKISFYFKIRNFYCLKVWYILVVYICINSNYEYLLIVLCNFIKV